MLLLSVPRGVWLMSWRCDAGDTDETTDETPDETPDEATDEATDETPPGGGMSTVQGRFLLACFKLAMGAANPTLVGICERG